MITMNICGNTEYSIPMAGISGCLVPPLSRNKPRLRESEIYKVRWFQSPQSRSGVLPLPVLYSKALPEKRFLLVPDGITAALSNEYETLVVSNHEHRSGVDRSNWSKLIRFLGSIDVDDLFVRVLSGPGCVEPESRQSASMLFLSQTGRLFIKGWEGFRGDAYNDSEGYCTIGYGHLIAKNRCESITLPLEFRNGITQQKANELFEHRIPEMETGVRDAVTVDLYQKEFDALVSLLFNTGSHFLAKRKAPKLLDKLNSGDYYGASQEFADITNRGTRGLVLRRKAEIDVFLHGIYSWDH